MKQKLICGLVMGCMVLALGGISLASEEQAPSKDMQCENGMQGMNHREHHDRMKDISEKLNALVAGQTINQEQADQILAFLKSKGEERKADFEKMKNMTPEERKAYMDELRAQRPSLIADLKANANLTEEQAKAVFEAIRPPRGFGFHDHERHIADKLKALVEQNTITQSEADQVAAFFKAKGEERKAEFEKTKNMTTEERKAYIDELRAQRPDFVTDLKANTNLTEEKAKAVAEAIRPHHDPARHIGNKLKALVEQNTITQEQADQIVAFFKNKWEEHKADFEKVKNMTPEERKAYMEEHRPQISEMIADLKTTANLTDEQAQAVAEAVRPHHGPRDCRPDDNGNMPPR